MAGVRINLKDGKYHDLPTGVLTSLDTTINAFTHAAAQLPITLQDGQAISISVSTIESIVPLGTGSLPDAEEPGLIGKES